MRARPAFYRRTAVEFRGRNATFATLSASGLSAIYLRRAFFARFLNFSFCNIIPRRISVILITEQNNARWQTFSIDWLHNGTLCFQNI